MDIIKLYASSVNESESRECSSRNSEARILFCEKLLEEIKKMDGIELSTHLSDVTFDVEKKESTLIFVF